MKPSTMILGQISYLDCVVFLVFLAPQLLIQVNPVELVLCVVTALPFLALRLPYQFIEERYFTHRRHQSPFVKKATGFQDFVIRCVRYAFAFFPAKIGRVFFSKGVALPFMRFRMLRHGYLHSPIPWREIDLGGCKGVWLAPDAQKPADLVILYCHGGGFSMGSTFFYLEFLLAWVSQLEESGYENPAIFSLEYTLVPDAAYPVQLEQAIAGFKYACSIAPDVSRVCVAGDSAGATLILSLLLSLSKEPQASQTQKPGFAALISPWTTLHSPQNRNTESDYLNADSLHLYARQYAGSPDALTEPLVSPGRCVDGAWWSRASPSGGYGFLFGSEEVLGPEMRDLISLLRKNGCDVNVREEPGGIHAWPVVTLFLSDTQVERQRGLKDLVKMIKQAIPASSRKQLLNGHS